MARFDKYRSVLANFKRDIEPAVARQNSEIDRANKEYNKSVLNDKISDIKSEHSGIISSIRNTYLKQLDEVTDSMRSRNSGKYRENYIDYDLLEKLNIISRSGVQLTTAELEAFTRTAMTSRSSFCVRKCQQMAKDSGFSLNVPSEAAANDVINETHERIAEIIQKYDGSQSIGYGVRGDVIAIKLGVSGLFIDDYEKSYENSTVEDITISCIDKSDYYKKKQQEEEKDEEIEITEAGHLGIQANDADVSSYAAEYARAYSARMLQAQPEDYSEE